uniref:Uncharacterized protein n=1 Tax=Timema shepardi TaxID=629360 RepID=A0A7R9B5J0_TIMSH|nr:unnamed protein product [Timema shepardi]
MSGLVALMTSRADHRIFRHDHELSDNAAIDKALRRQTYSSSVASLVLTDSSQLTSDSQHLDILTNLSLASVAAWFKASLSCCTGPLVTRDQVKVISLTIHILTHDLRLQSLTQRSAVPLPTFVSAGQTLPSSYFKLPPLPTPTPISSPPLPPRPDHPRHSISSANPPITLWRVIKEI